MISDLSANLDTGGSGMPPSAAWRDGCGTGQRLGQRGPVVALAALDLCKLGEHVPVATVKVLPHSCLRSFQS